MYCKNFSELSKEDAAIAGGKGASLGEMTSAFAEASARQECSHNPVPPGFVVVAGAFEKFLEETDLNVEIDAILHSVDTKAMHTVEHASETIQKLILEAKMPEDIASKITADFQTLDAKHVAVRSSATAEDSASAAWAGQLDSFLNTTEESLLQNVQRCWASLFTPRAIFYRFEQGLHDSKISVAVVVQKMVESEVSGIAFSVHPVTEDRNQLIIEAGYGLGEAIVSGQITPDSYVVEKNLYPAPTVGAGARRIIDKNIAEQERGIFRLERAGAVGDPGRMEGNEWRDIPMEKRKLQKLSDEQIFALSEIIIGIENHYGFPCDIEWAFQNNTFYIVQSRPITTLSQLQEKTQVKELTQGHKVNYQKHQRDYTLLATTVVFNVYLSPRLQEYFSFKPSPMYVVVDRGELAHYINEDDSFHRASSWASKYGEIHALRKQKIMHDKILSGYRQFLRDEHLKVKESLALLYEYFAELLPLILVAIEVPEYAGDAVDKEVLELCAKIRIENEDVYKVGIDMERELLSKLEIQNALPKGILAYLTVEEFRQYIKDDVLPEDIQKRSSFVLVRQSTDGEEVYSEKNRMKELGLIDEITSIDTGLIKGTTAFPGVVTGRVRVIKSVKDAGMLTDGEVLVACMTDPRYVTIMRKASAIITDEGGITCHAAIVSRELKKPCIIGTKIATQVLKDGDLVEVDADNGVVRVLERVNGEEDIQKITEVDWEKLIEREMDVFLFSSALEANSVLMKEIFGFGYEKILVNYIGTKGTLFHSRKELEKSKEYFRDLLERKDVRLEEWLREEERLQGLEVPSDPAELIKYFQNILLFNTLLPTRVLFAIEGEEKFEYLISLYEGMRNRGTYPLLYKEKIGPLLKRIAKEKGIPEELSGYLTLMELRDLLNNKGFIIESVLRNRKNGCTLYLLDGKTGILNTVLKNTAQSEEARIKTDQISGEIAFRGVRQGHVRIVNTIDQMRNFKDGEILVSISTNPSLILAIKKACAIITDEGGIISHAAIVAREMKKPCIIGTKIATQVLKDGDLVEVDACPSSGVAERGIVKILKRK